MKTERIIWGIVLLFIGGILLLQNFNVIDFEWGVIWKFWPVVLILIGVNMLFSNSSSQSGGFALIFITMLILGFIAYKGINIAEDEKRGIFFRDDHNDGDLNSESSVYSEPFISGTRKAILNIKGGATSFILNDTTAELVTAQVEKTYGNYSLFKFSNDSTETVEFNMTGKNSWDMDKSKANKVVFSLNPLPLWDINLETGAGKTEFDLTKFKIRNIQLKGGVASFDVKLGSLNNITTVNVESGVSKIKISVPESVGCEIKTTSGLSSNDFSGFNKINDGSYQTSNFASSPQKITIILQGGLSSFDVERY